MRKSILLLAIHLCLSSFAEVKVNSSANNYLNQAMWSQVLNNFDVNTPIVVVTPWAFFYTNINSIDNEVFFKDNLEEEKIFSHKNTILKELYSTVNNDFFKMIPADSTMIVRALYKDRLLYTLSLNKSDTMMTIDYLLPDNQTGVNAVFDQKGNLVSNSHFNPDNSIMTTNVKQSDSLFICTTDNESKVYYTIEESKYKHGLLLRKTIFRSNKETNKRKFVSNKTYIYNDNRSLSQILITNKKGIPIDSIEYHYVDDKLFSIIQKHYNSEADMIFYQYENDQITGKTIQSSDVPLQINKKFKNRKLSFISIINESDNKIEQYELDYNVQGQLSSMMYRSGRLSDDINACFEKQYIFSYNEYNNIRSIKVVDKQGVVHKEIDFEYEFR